MLREKILNKVSQYRFEIRHITIFFTVLILFQIILAIVQKSTLDNFLNETQGWYQKHSAERLAIVTSTSMELLFENLYLMESITENEERQFVSSLSILFKQQLIQKSVEDICLILKKKHRIYIIDTGPKLRDYLHNELEPYNGESNNHDAAINLYLEHKDAMRAEEVIFSSVEEQKTFSILVPFVPNGEYLGVLFIKISPNFSFFTNEVSNSFNNVAIVYSILIMAGLIAIFFVSSQAVKERNEAQHQLFEEHKENLKKQIRLEKESLFTKRIYHTHHKAEKIIGFIKEDIRQINADNIEDIKHRVVTYSNFISRIIYDMKWYDQPLNTIINPMFRTNINEVIGFIMNYVFLRISSKNEMFDFETNLDPKLPIVNVNEFIVWEILEPLIQNSIDHGKKDSIRIKVTTKYDQATNKSVIEIADNGVGVAKELLVEGENGVKKVFLENESTKKNDGANSGYGCYIAYQMAAVRCGWKVDVENLPEGGCKFTMVITH
ncbi:MAG: ATP-binding protein [Melioribacteraceae bacterium]|nr:ATP-binding protein [Melioribacteraceae bacterium]MCF8266144.1 ATP-binding protein [Melioribacteraceae bacterium]MCF8413581.1 ATP-binding protein [Melioribacteraceae bacterium]MCF8432373.1 ATP-binding protein [Melioribacteraceae bacterium]